MPINLTLLDRSGNVPDRSGLNWCYANAHVCNEDAYIKISKSIICNSPSYFPPKSVYSIINVQWDDGMLMTCLLEGNQTINGIDYPKQISSNNDKSVIGHYLRGRIGVFGRRVNINDLNSYGRTDIEVTHLGSNNYRFDFS